jgi:DNA-binding FadR family transcriptional regulator
MSLPAQRSAESNRLAADLRQRIVSGTLEPGDRLPDERTMAADLRVARVTVRTALTRLQSEGLLERVQGRGTVVRDFRQNGGPQLITAVLDHAQKSGSLDVQVAEFLALRRHLAAAVLERIPVPFGATRARPLRDAIGMLETTLEQGAERDVVVAADLKVAQALVAASGSAMLQLMFNPISEALRGHASLRDALYQRPAENLRAWRAMLTWCQGPSRSTDAILDGMRLRDETTLKRMRAA